MARRLTAARAAVPPGDRAAYLEAVTALAAHHRRHGGHFWLFEGADRRGEFLEFAESAGGLPAVEPALRDRLAALARYDPARDAEWLEVPLADSTGG